MQYTSELLFDKIYSSIFCMFKYRIVDFFLMAVLQYRGFLASYIPNAYILYMINIMLPPAGYIMK